MARALVFEPRLVLMDEPLSALDKKLREQMQLEIRRLHRELGVTMVYVTHDQSEAMTLSDRVAVFNQGRVEQLATPKQLYDAPANPFVAGFLGDNNMIDAAVESGSAGAAVQLRAADGSALRARGGPAFVHGRARPPRCACAPRRCASPLMRALCRRRTGCARRWSMRSTRATTGAWWCSCMAPHRRPRNGSPRSTPRRCRPALATGQDIDLAFRAEDAWAF